MTPGRPYRLAIRAYPPHHRRRHGDEMIATALEMDDGRWSARQAWSFIGNGLRASVVEPRRWWGLAVIFPVLFAAAQLAYFVALGRADEPGWEGTVYGAAWLLKWLTVPSLPALLFLLAEKVAEHPVRWRTATMLWLVVGVGLVLGLATRIDSISATISNVASWRLWPTNLTGPGQGALDAAGGFGPHWTPNQILVRELAGVVALAVASGLAIRRCARVALPVLAAGAVPLVVMGVLFFYKLIAPWSFRMDFDFFVGDVVLGSTLGELIFFPAPFDPVGSLAIGLAALSMGGLIIVWGGPAAPPDRRPMVISVSSKPGNTVANTITNVAATPLQRSLPEARPES